MGPWELGHLNSSLASALALGDPLPVPTDFRGGHCFIPWEGCDERTTFLV